MTQTALMDLYTFDEIEESFLMLFEKEKKELAPKEIQLIEYWYNADKEQWRNISMKWQDAEDLLQFIVQSIFFLSWYGKGSTSDRMEYLIDITSPAFRRHIRVIDICPLGGIMGNVHWEKIPGNISLLKNLTHVQLNTHISDIEPLRGLQLHFLCIGGSNVRSIEVTQDMPLWALRFADTKVDSITPIENSQTITWVQAHGSKIDKRSIETLESVTYLNAASIGQGTKITTFPDKINQTVHKNVGRYDSDSLSIKPPSHTVIDTFWWGAYLRPRK